MSFFQFRHFKVCHDRCAMKVGTDGVLLGAWADTSDAHHILDIGCGSGIITLMLAQRTKAVITGIEIDRSAAEQAKENCLQSPFCNRITIVNHDLRGFLPSQPVDCIVSNPPFFEEDLLPPDARRATARHTAVLNFETLIAEVSRLLLPNGLFSVILPYSATRRFTILCAARDLNLKHRTDVITAPGKRPKRSLLTFRNAYSRDMPIFDVLCLTAGSGQRSEEWETLSHDFYIK